MIQIFMLLCKIKPQSYWNLKYVYYEYDVDFIEKNFGLCIKNNIELDNLGNISNATDKIRQLRFIESDLSDDENDVDVNHDDNDDNDDNDDDDDDNDDDNNDDKEGESSTTQQQSIFDVSFVLKIRLLIHSVSW